MKRLTNFVTLHPYFKVHAGQLPGFKALMSAFTAKTASEENALFYEFTVNGDEVFCREGYTDAAATLGHLGNVGEILTAAGKISDLTRLEIHGPAAELAKMKAPLAQLPVVWFEIAEPTAGR